MPQYMIHVNILLDELKNNLVKQKIYPSSSII